MIYNSKWMYGPALVLLVIVLGSCGPDSKTESVKNDIGILEQIEIENREMLQEAIGAIGGDPESSDNAAVLIELLKHEDEYIRLLAAKELGKRGEKTDSIISALMATIQNDDSISFDVRVIAFEALEKLDPNESLIIQCLKSSHPWVRKLAANYFVETAPPSEPVIEALIKVLQVPDSDATYSGIDDMGTPADIDVDDDLRSTAAYALGRIGGMARIANKTLLIQAMEDKNDYARESAIEALVEIDSPAKDSIAELIKALDSNSEQLRVYAVWTLGEIGPEAKDAYSGLLKLISDESDEVREYAIKAAVDIGPVPDDGELVQAVMKALKDESDYVRAEAVRSLGLLSPENPHIITAALINALKDDSSRVRKWAASALEKSGIKDESVIKALQKALKDKNGDVRGDAAYALWRLTGNAEIAMPVLIQLLPVEETRFTAVFNLGRMGEAAQRAVTPLFDIMFEDDRASLIAHTVGKCQAAYAIWQISGNVEETVPVLIKALNSEEAFAPIIAVEYLEEMGPAAAKAVPALIALLEKDSAYARPIAQALGAIGDSVAVPVLQETLVREPDREIKAIIQAAIDILKKGT